MPAATPPPTYSHQQIARAAARRLQAKSPRVTASRRPDPRNPKKKKWSIGPTFIPGVEGVTFEEFTPEMQGQYPGSYAADPQRNVIYRAKDQPYDKDALAHEMGHLLSRYASDDDKANFMKIMGFQPGEWNTGTGATKGGLKSPNEYFSDYYMATINHMDPRRQGGMPYANDITRKRLKLFAAALAKFGRYNQLGSYKEPTWPY